MIILIFLGLFQALMLPGLVVIYGFRINLPLLDKLILAAPLSLLLNSWLVAFLYGLSIYSQKVLLFAVAVEMVVVVFLFYTKADEDIVEPHVYDSALIKVLFGVLLVLFLCYFIKVYRPYFLTVFSDWDAVASWNKWALEISDHDFRGSAGYPLGIPVLLSIVYKVAGSANVESFSKLIYFYWFSLSGLVLFRAGVYSSKYRIQLAFSSLFLLYLSVKAFGASFLFGGYVDPVMITFGSLLIYFISLLRFRIDRLPSNKVDGVVVLFAYALSSSALVKMSGVLLTILFVVVIYSYYRRAKNPSLNLIDAMAVVLLSVAWYFFSLIYWNDYQALYSYSALQDSRYFIRPFIGINRLYSSWGWVVLLLFSLGMAMHKLSRVLCLVFVMPLFLFWSTLVGYDSRAASIFFPLVSFAVAAAGWLLLVNAVNLYASFLLIFRGVTRTTKNRSVAAVLSVVVTLGFLSLYVTESDIISDNIAKKTHANDFGGHRQLMDIFSSEPSSKVISCWQMPTGLPGVKGRFIPTSCAGGVSEVNKWLSNDEIKYLLYWRSYDEKKYPTKKEIDEYLTNRNVRFSDIELAPGYVLYSKK